MTEHIEPTTTDRAAQVVSEGADAASGTGEDLGPVVREGADPVASGDTGPNVGAGVAASGGVGRTAGAGTAGEDVGPTEWGTTVGVGPWEGAWPSDDRYDPDLLEHGDRRNVVDHYRYWRREAVVADLDARRHDFHVAIENFQHDHNIGTVVRTANAFAARAVHIVGRRRWNRRGAMVTDRYQHVHHHPDVESLVDWAHAQDLAVVAVDNTPGAEPVERAALPPRCVLLFGQEGPGISDDSRGGADQVVSISQFGSTRSINAGVAAGIVMHTWIQQHADLTQAW